MRAVTFGLKWNRFRKKQKRAFTGNGLNNYHPSIAKPENPVAVF